LTFSFTGIIAKMPGFLKDSKLVAKLECEAHHDEYEPIWTKAVAQFTRLYLLG